MKRSTCVFPQTLLEKEGPKAKKCRKDHRFFSFLTPVWPYPCEKAIDKTLSMLKP